jgi:hypothetical protein
MVPLILLRFYFVANTHPKFDRTRRHNVMCVVRKANVVAYCKLLYISGCVLPGSRQTTDPPFFRDRARKLLCEVWVLYDVLPDKPLVKGEAALFAPQSFNQSIITAHN